MRYQQDISGCIAHERGATRLSDYAYEEALRACEPALNRLRKAHSNDEFPFLHLPSEGAQLGAAFNLAEKIRCRAKEIVVLGTGGSSLGGRALVALVGDPLYGGRLRLPKGTTDELREALSAFNRQALHARQLALEHPETGEILTWEVPLPEDMVALIEALRKHARELEERDF